MIAWQGLVRFRALSSRGYVITRVTPTTLLLVHVYVARCSFENSSTGGGGVLCIPIAAKVTHGVVLPLTRTISTAFALLDTSGPFILCKLRLRVSRGIEAR